MEFTNEGVLKRKIDAVQDCIFSDVEELSNWEMREGFLEAPGDYRVDNRKEWTEIRVGEYWECGVATTRWFRKIVTVPERFEGKTIVLDLVFGGDGLVRINGEIRSTVTEFIKVSHATTRSRVFVTDCAHAGQKFEILVEAALNYLEFFYFGDPNRRETEYKFQKARLAALDSAVEEYYFDIKMAYEVMITLKNPTENISNSALMLSGEFGRLLDSLGRNSYIYSTILDAVLTSLNEINFDFGREALCESIPKAREILWSKIDKIKHSPHALIKFVGQTHIDTAWLWPLKETVRKCGKTMANVLDLMERYPELIFTFSQPQLFSYIKEHYPELYERVKEKVRSGQFELIGNTWVEMDTNIPSGESIVRQLLYGKNYFINEFGKSSDVFWMPDVFGYSSALPQIIKKSGMKYFFTSKLISNDTNRFPHSLFMWKGIDGTSILSYLQRMLYNGDYCPDTVDVIYNKFDQKNISDELLMTFGYGDGGGGPTYQMLEAAKRLKSFPGLQKTEINTAASFFDTAADLEDKLPVWSDEIYFENHRGTYTSQANTKKNNRKAELMYRQAEMAASFAKKMLNMDYPYEEILKGYQIVLTNQFHDILPGSSIKDVYEDCAKDYAQAFAIINKVFDNALKALTATVSHDKDTIFVFNFLSWERSGYVTIYLKDRKDTDLVVINADGKKLPTTARQMEHGVEVSFEADKVVSMGYAAFKLVKGSYEGSVTIKVNAYCMENDYFKLLIDPCGNIKSIYDKKNDCEALDGTRISNILQIFEDKPAYDNAWNINLEYRNKMWELNTVQSIEVIEQSSVKGVLRIIKRFNKSTISQDITIYHSAPRIDFITNVDWQETEKMLKAAFYPNVMSTRATFEIQFGSIERPTHWNTSYDKTKFEVCGHKWADLSEGAYGVSLLNDCKYGYDIKENCMRLTLLRSPIKPDPSADKGLHEFTYSLYPHAEDWRRGRTVQEGYALNVPLVAVFAPEEIKGVSNAGSVSYAQVDKQNVIIDTIKCAEDKDGIILRVYESIGARSKVKLTLNMDVGKVFECNLMEENEKRYDYIGNTVEFYIKPYEIKTFRLK